MAFHRLHHHHSTDLLLVSPLCFPYLRAMTNDYFTEVSSSSQMYLIVPNPVSWPKSNMRSHVPGSLVWPSQLSSKCPKQSSKEYSGDGIGMSSSFNGQYLTKASLYLVNHSACIWRPRRYILSLGSTLCLLSIQQWVLFLRSRLDFMQTGQEYFGFLACLLV